MSKVKPPFFHLFASLLVLTLLLHNFQGTECQQTNFVNHLNKLKSYAEPQWFLDNIPFVDLPDTEIEEIYYYRWSSHKRHLRYTAPGGGYVVTEFVNDPGYSGKFDTINAAAGHHIYESRWLRNKRYVQDYINFWTRNTGNVHQYKDWVADAAYHSFLLDSDIEFLKSQQSGLVRNFNGWNTNFDEDLQMYHISPAWDAMEYSCSSVGTDDQWGGGVGYRPSFNGEMYGNALAIARIAQMNDDEATAAEFLSRAEIIRASVLKNLWDPERKFFYHMHRDENPDQELLGSREEIGFFAWRWKIPDNTTDHVAAWEQLLDPQGFNTKYGPATCEVRSEYYDGDQPIDQCCWWNGNSWPYSTGFTLNSLATLLRTYKVTGPFTVQDYVDLLRKYAQTQYKNGNPYVAECHSPENDYWVCDSDRSPHYAHSTYTDNVLAELIGVQPQEDDTFVIDPLIPGTWTFFAAENIPYHGHEVTVLYDKDGSYYESGHSGLQIFVNGQFVQSQDTVGRMSVPVPPPLVSISNGQNKVENLAANVYGKGYPQISVSFNGIMSNPSYLTDGRIFYDRVPINRWSNFDSGTDTDWLALDFGSGRTRTFNSVKLYIYSDVVTNEGRCDCPKKIVIEYLDDPETDNWLPVSNPVQTPAICSPNAANVISFDPISTQKVRAVFTRDVANDYYIGLTEVEIWASWPLSGQNIYEAEDGVISGSKIEPAVNASSGAYVNVPGIDGGSSSVEFTGIWVDNSGPYNINVFYANSQDVNATQIVLINNQDTLTATYLPTHGWDNFQNFITLSVNLLRGNNVLIFNYEHYDVQMDKIEVLI